MGPAELIQHVSAAHTRICYSSVSPLQEACAVGMSFDSIASVPHCRSNLTTYLFFVQALNRPRRKASGTNASET